MLAPPPAGVPLLLFGLAFLIQAFLRHSRASFALGSLLVALGLLLA